MGTTQIMRRFEFDAAHRVLGHAGKCRNLHGHRFVAEVTVRAENLNLIGMVIDFSFLKEIIGGWIDSQWDHNVLLNRIDPLCDYLKEQKGEKPPYIMADGANPTAENIAKWLFKISASLLSDKWEHVKVVHVRVWETPSCFADYTEE